MGLNGRLAFAIGAAAFGSAFQHGYNTGVVNAPAASVKEWIAGCNESQRRAENCQETDICNKCEAEVTLIWSWIVSVMCIGGAMGSAAVGFVSSRFGRRGGLLLNNVFMAIASVFLFASKFSGSYEMLIVGRLVIGINAGLNAGLAPMYLTEISPVSLRGSVGTVYQLIITISILLSQVFGLDTVLGNDHGWPYLFGLTLIPGILQLVTLPFCPESPKHLLLEKNDEEKATSSLAWLRGTNDVQEEMNDLRSEHESIKQLPKVTFKEMLVNPSLRAPLIIAMMMMLAQQLSGINAAISYSTSIFTDGGLEAHEAQSATLGMGAMNVAMTIVSLIMIEKAGRKTLMISGLSVMVFATTMLLICQYLAHIEALRYISIAMVITFVVGFATGPGSIPWFFVTELFTQSGRGMATSCAGLTNWFANFLVNQLFPTLKYQMGPSVFAIFIATQIIFIVYVWFKVPETKNKKIEEITAQFRQNL